MREQPDSICPYCGTMQDKAIRRKTTCKDCGSVIYFNSKFKYIYNNRPQLTRKELSLVLFWKELWEMLNIDEDYFLHIKQLLAKKGLTDPYDIVWHISNGEKIVEYVEEGRKIGQKYMDTRLNTIQSGIASARARFVPYYFHEDPYSYAKQALEFDLELMLSDSAIKSVYVNADICCDACREIANKLFPIKSALRDALLPNKKCTRILEDTDIVLCSCSYLPDFNLNYQ